MVKIINTLQVLARNFSPTSIHLLLTKRFCFGNKFCLRSRPSYKPFRLWRVGALVVGKHARRRAAQPHLVLWIVGLARD